MVDVRLASRSFLTAAISALVVAQGEGCSAVEERPVDAVKAYFHGLASDAVATLLVTSPRFQAQHGLRVTQAQAWEPARGTPVELTTGDESPEPEAQTDAPRAPDVDPSSPPEIARAQLGWIVLLKLRSFREQAAALAVEIVQVEHTDDHAIVTTRVTPRGVSPFTQRFFLTRKDGTGRWRIDSIEQEDVKLGSRRAAFTAAPTETARRRILPSRAR
jgi:hypothetical protein